MAGFGIDPFLQYSVLGVMGFLFLKLSGRSFNGQMEQQKLLINNLINQKNESIDNIEDLVGVVLQAVNNHNSRAQEVYGKFEGMIEKLEGMLSTEVDEKEDIYKVLTDVNIRSHDQQLDMTKVVNELRMILLEMKKTCGFGLSTKQVGQRLVDKGIITNEQLRDVLYEQQQDELETLTIKKEEDG